MSMERRAEIENYLKSALKRRLEAAGRSDDQINDDLQFIQSGLMDSVGFLDLLGEMEEKFDIEVDFDDKDPKEFLSYSGFLSCLFEAA